MKNILKKVSVFTIAVALMMELISTSVLGWAGELDQDPNTHTLLVTQALQILENDLTSEDKNDSEFMDVINRLKASIEDFKRGAIMPDFDDKNFSLYQDHFYNPYTKTNFTASNEGELVFLDFIYQTAEYRSKEYIGWALQYWKSGDYNRAIYTLGNAMHYFADLCNPHHASNAIGGTQEHITKHSTFETYVENTKDQYTITTLGGNTSTSNYSDTLQDEYLPDFITKECDIRAIIGYEQYHNNFVADNESTWNGVADVTMKSTQRGIARVLYRFAKEIANPSSVCSNTYDSNITLNIRVKTKDGALTDTYGTDNDVYFGVELKNGRMHEWKLDKSGYNDHEKGANDTYTVILEKSVGSEIRKAWIRKQRGWEAGTAEDNWYPIEVEVTSSDNQCHFLKPLDMWFIGNTGVDIVVSDCNYILDKVDVRIKTKDGGLFDAYGTDSDVYFGVQLSDGTTHEKLLDKSGYNDFEKGDDDWYSIEYSRLPDTVITKAWLKKVGSDDWYPENITITNDDLNFNADINQWFYDNTIKEWVF